MPAITKPDADSGPNIKQSLSDREISDLTGEAFADIELARDLAELIESDSLDSASEAQLTKAVIEVARFYTNSGSIFNKYGIEEARELLSTVEPSQALDILSGQSSRLTQSRELFLELGREHPELVTADHLEAQLRSLQSANQEERTELCEAFPEQALTALERDKYQSRYVTEQRELWVAHGLDEQIVERAIEKLAGSESSRSQDILLALSPVSEFAAEALKEVIAKPGTSPGIRGDLLREVLKSKEEIFSTVELEEIVSAVIVNGPSPGDFDPAARTMRTLKLGFTALFRPDLLYMYSGLRQLGEERGHYPSWSVVELKGLALKQLNNLNPQAAQQFAESALADRRGRYRSLAKQILDSGDEA